MLGSGPGFGVSYNNAGQAINAATGAFNVKAAPYGAQGNTITLNPTNVTSTSGQNLFNISGANFTFADIGKGIMITGAGAGGNPLISTISAVINSTTITTAALTGTALSASAQNVFYGTDDTAAIQAAFSAAVNSPYGGEVLFPPGTYFISSQINAAFTGNNYAGIGAIGSGNESTILFFPGSNGLNIGIHFLNQSFRVRDITFATGSKPSIANYIALNVTGPNTSPGTQNDIAGCTFRGINAATWFWQTQINVSGLGNINFNNLWITAPVDAAPNFGVVLSNASGSNNSVYNFSQCNWSGGNIGIVVGSYVQGVTCNECTWGGMNVGIETLAAESGTLGQLSVTNCASVTQGNFISLNTAMQTIQLSSNFIIVPNAIAGISINAACYGMNIVGNQFTNFTAQSGQGISIGGGAYAGTISGNLFSNLGTGIALLATSSYINVQSNLYYTCGATVTNAGSNNTIGGGSA